ncbi:MAG: nuclear transport factor 2 family protein [Acidobacteria bacterium]|nr:nuclear transport factor 2 family protein [Gemmatimonadaceae bacterium]NUR52922.1 nuclear transport factor 2 family protein [Acidobacteriota bacterium]
MRLILTIAIVAPIAFAPALRAQRTDTSTAPDTTWRVRVRNEVNAAEHRRRAALLDHDANALAHTLAEDFVEVTLNGDRTRATNLADTRAGRVKWMRLVVTDETVTIFDSLTAAVAGVLDGGGTYDDRPFARYSRFLRVYLRRDGQWRNIAAANVPLPHDSTGAPNGRNVADTCRAASKTP